jgi:hypothetical protein
MSAAVHGWSDLVLFWSLHKKSVVIIGTLPISHVSAALGICADIP